MLVTWRYRDRSSLIQRIDPRAWMIFYICFLFSSLQFWDMRYLFIFFVLSLVGGGAAYAAQDAMPGDTLYSLKLATEDLRLRLTFSDTSKAELLAEFAERRVEEILYLAEKGTTDRGEIGELEHTESRLEDSLRAIKKIAVDRQQEIEDNESGTEDLPGTTTPEDQPSTSSDDPILEKLRDLLQDHRDDTESAFQEAVPLVPEEVKPVLESALEEYQRYSTEALEATGDTSTTEQDEEDSLDNNRETTDALSDSSADEDLPSEDALADGASLDQDTSNRATDDDASQDTSKDIAPADTQDAEGLAPAPIREEGGTKR